MPSGNLDRYCYLYSHTYNNIIIDGEAFFAGANFIYSDVSAARGPIQKEPFLIVCPDSSRLLLDSHYRNKFSFDLP